jgi:lipopolysaccharide export LptBFGC system permease protein LptF
MWLSIFLGVVVVSLLIIITFLIHILKVQINKHKIYEQWIIDTQNLVTQAYQTMKDIDEKGYFQAEDEVGNGFRQIIDVIEYVNKVVQNE